LCQISLIVSPRLRYPESSVLKEKAKGNNVASSLERALATLETASDIYEGAQSRQTSELELVVRSLGRGGTERALAALRRGTEPRPDIDGLSLAHAALVTVFEPLPDDDSSSKTGTIVGLLERQAV
jgi:hypothetical protein